MVRGATMEDIAPVMAIYGIARTFMAQSGNASQWGMAYPPQELIEADIRKGQLYVYVEGDAIHGVFVLMTDPEPSYARIEGGAWKSAAAYATIHRVAGDGVVKGIFGQCLEFCKARHKHLCIDTHADNHIMQHLIKKGGFERRGIIYLENGDSRIAFEYIQGE